jgi:methyl-accepting chemotaxis protein
VGLLLLEMAIIVGALAWLTYQHVERLQGIVLRLAAGNESGASAVHGQLEMLTRQFYTWSLVLLAATVILLILCGLFASHKLAGPVFKLTRYFEAVASGEDSRRIAFRRKDRLDAFANQINAAMDAVAARRGEVSGLLVGLRKRIDDLGHTKSADEARRLVNEMEEVVSQLTASVEVEGHS